MSPRRTNASKPAAVDPGPIERLIGRKPASSPSDEKNPLESKTARVLLEVAERLFAEHGVEMVPLRQVAAAAGQRNHSALHYYFGSRETLVSQLLNMRLVHVNALRNQYLDDVERHGQQSDIRAIIRASIQALVDAVEETPWGPNYIQVLAQTTFSPQLLSFDAIDPQAITGMVRTRRLMASALGDIPPQVWQDRALWFNQNVVYSIAYWSRYGRAAGVMAPVENLIDYCAGALTAEVSKAPLRRRASKG